MALGALTVAGLLVFIPSQVTRIKNTRAALIAQTHILDELHDFAGRAPRACAVSVPNRRAVPQLALWTDRRPGTIRSAQEDGRYSGTAFVPVSRAVADQFVLNASDEEQALPAPPSGRPALRGRYWEIYPGC
jgi:hypothetical protein